MDVFVVRKLGVPGHEELAMGAIASGGARVLNHDLLNYLNVDQQVGEGLCAFPQSLQVMLILQSRIAVRVR